MCGICDWSDLLFNTICLKDYVPKGAQKDMVDDIEKWIKEHHHVTPRQSIFIDELVLTYELVPK